MSSWRGATLDEVITQWGYPTSQQNIAGRQLYYWSYDKSTFTPAVTTGTVNTVGNTTYLNTTTTGGGYSTWNCTRILETDKRNIVVGGQWSGNNCPFMEVLEYAHWRRKL